MAQAIQTKYFGPGDVRGARVKAWTQAGSLTIGWDYRLNSPNNHREAASALANKLGWLGVWRGGALPDGGYTFIQDTGDERDGFEVVAK